MYKEDEVRRAIALLKIRKSEKHIPNLAGYFTTALKGGWSCSKTVVDEEGVDTATVFRLWYDLALELGCCTSQKIENSEQWVLMSGSWERWEDTIARGYSLEYLKGKLNRNSNGYRG